MQQVECYTKKHIRNYSQIGGDTGPVVYPAGHLLTYSVFYTLTNAGKDIRTGQYIFMALYLLNLLAVFRLYYKSNRIAPFVLVFLCLTGYRIHSIFVLRLFNDPVAMLFFYLAANFFVSQQWLIGCLLYSFAVSIKMNVLLFAPALLFILLLNVGVWRTIVNLAICAVVQVYVGLPFLMYDPVSYIRRSFDLGRVFLFKWTVNWRFLPEEVFLSPRLHIALLSCHLVVLVVFGYHMWFRDAVRLVFGQLNRHHIRAISSLPVLQLVLSPATISAVLELSWNRGKQTVTLHTLVVDNHKSSGFDRDRNLLERVSFDSAFFCVPSHLSSCYNCVSHSEQSRAFQEKEVEVPVRVWRIIFSLFRF
ncbi:ALG3 protein [Oesophagostomum dentatum]|uniref:dolichyl-P-Man:Man5GlcNAc2-PP-dolichol alpha-1,3-mannosyltransferase n=1 Tax=Oesophagostomum dentatum TaxID=61180 RepID=A0A0B1SQX9_OESDE|nr:ALG3 protein [Oesophagostomum dentatum]